MSNREYENSDEHLYYCPECKKVWEQVKKKRCTTIEYYEGFPSYGKKRVTCSNCKIQIGMKNVSMQNL